MDKKYGAYVCTGCGIGDTLDTEALCEVASSEMNMECKTFQALCSADGRALIEGDINDGVNTVVVAACSPRVMQDEFDFGDDKITVRANLREQVAWSHEPNDEDTQMLAEDAMRMASVRAEKGEVPVPIDEPVDHSIMVVGGGMTGLATALEVADVGLPVRLIEKAAELGGRVAANFKSFPTKAPWTELEPNSVPALIERVLAHDIVCSQDIGSHDTI